MELTEGTDKKENSLDELSSNLKQVLDVYLPKELRERPDVQVFSVGCGFALEAQPILDLIPGAKYTGVDLGRYFPKAADIRYHSDRVNVRSGDLTNREEFGNNPWDLVIIRNPKIISVEGGSDPNWEKILVNSELSVASNGYILVTAMSLVEMESTMNFLKQTGLQQQTPVKDISEMMTSNFPLKENYLAILKKGN